MIRASRLFKQTKSDGEMTEVKLIAYSDEKQSKVWIVTATGRVLTEIRSQSGACLEVARKAWKNLTENLKRQGFVAGEMMVVDSSIPF